eukprot:7043027-Pyramimonas_sp.AAC.1
MRVFVAKHRPIFFHPERASERERDRISEKVLRTHDNKSDNAAGGLTRCSIEGEVGLFVKACKESIDKLQDKIQEEISKRTKPSKHYIAHLQGA